MKYLYIPPALILYCIIIMFMLNYHMPQYNLIEFPFNLAGVLIAFSGFVLMGKAKDLIKKHQTTLQIEKSSHLVVEGVFSKTRNPMYMGMAILILGLSVISTNMLALILPLLFIIIVGLVFVRKEEKLMCDVFGNDYLEYKKRVRRWL